MLSRLRPDRLLKISQQWWFPSALLIGSILLVFWPAVNTWFVGDDFYWLYVGRNQMATPAGWILAFTHSNGAGQYRPVSADVYYWLGWLIFGMHAYAWHLALLAIFIVSALIVYRLVTHFTGTRWLAFGSTCLWALSISHFEGIAWGPTVDETGAMVPAFLCLLATVLGKRQWAIALYVLSLLSNETTVVLPAMILVYYLIWERTTFVEAIRRTLPLWAIFALYAVIRIFVPSMHPVTAGVFTVVVNPVTWLNLTVQSLLWSLDFFNVLANLVWYNGPQWHVASSIVVFVVLASLAALVVVACVFGFRQSWWESPGPRLVALGALWFLLGLVPVLPFANNFASYNLALSVVGISLVVGGLARMAGRSGPYLVAILAFAFFVLSILTVDGPQGMESVDVYPVLARTSYSAYIEMTDFEMAHPGPLHVYVDSDSNVIVWTLDHLVYLVSPQPGTTMCFEHSCAHESPVELDLHFDPASDQLTVMP